MVTRNQIAHEVAARREALAERAGASREELARRAEMGREELMRRAEEIRESFAENVTQEVVTNFVGWTLISTGIAWGVTDWMRGRRTVRTLLLPIGMLVLGTAVLGGGTAWHRRSEHISETEERVRAELQALDPFARFRILRDVAEETVPFVRRMSVRN